MSFVVVRVEAGKFLALSSGSRRCIGIVVPHRPGRMIHENPNSCVDAR
jgi:hypothetical protein